MTLNPRVIDETLETLEDFQILDPSGREKVAADLLADPNDALRLLARVVSISAPAHSEGSGLPKSASVRSTTADPDGWDEVIRNGA